MIRAQAGPGVDTSELTRGWTSTDDREAVASDLLKVLHSIPIQAIATNGPSLVHKVRFVASTLLDAVRKAETAPASAARAHAYLCELAYPWPLLFHTLIFPLQGISCPFCPRLNATTCTSCSYCPPYTRLIIVRLLTFQT